ncbi:hypothetical protein BCF33_0921 [Hasllibacter halocynthiae]|uniref:Uncharacterized protein n=1 Tax=Hasllibacter halocynthiae TaxID=595589 RepID=A0A2T0X8P3_9RHOB|nr:hypothetical protein BCF33_0921 [Hasllibacter halocynthiae]
MPLVILIALPLFEPANHLTSLMAVLPVMASAGVF